MTIAFDIGGCIGESLHRFVDYTMVFSFEPAWWTYIGLVAKSKQFPNVVPYNLAISDVNGMQQFNRHGYFQFSSFLPIDMDGEFGKACTLRNPNFNTILDKFDVQTKRLDTFMYENQLDHIDFLKTDTQGYDFKVVKSLGKFLPKVKTIELEVQLKSLYIGAPTKEEIVEYMLARNFSVTEVPEYEPYRIGNEQDLIFENLDYHN